MYGSTRTGLRQQIAACKEDPHSSLRQTEGAMPSPPGIPGPVSPSSSHPGIPGPVPPSSSPPASPNRSPRHLPTQASPELPTGLHIGPCDHLFPVQAIIPCTLDKRQLKAFPLQVGKRHQRCVREQGWPSEEPREEVQRRFGGEAERGWMREDGAPPGGRTCSPAP